MIEEYERFLKCSKPIVFYPSRKYFITGHNIKEGWVAIDSELVGAEYYRYFVRMTKGLQLVLGYGVDWFFGDQLNSLCLEEYKCL